MWCNSQVLRTSGTLEKKEYYLPMQICKEALSHLQNWLLVTSVRDIIANLRSIHLPDPISSKKSRKSSYKRF